MTELRDVLLTASGVLLAVGVVCAVAAVLKAIEARRQDWRGEGNTEGQR